MKPCERAWSIGLRRHPGSTAGRTGACFGRRAVQLAKREAVRPFERLRCASTSRGGAPFAMAAAAATAGIPMEPKVGTRSAREALWLRDAAWFFSAWVFMILVFRSIKTLMTAHPPVTSQQ